MNRCCCRNCREDCESRNCREDCERCPDDCVRPTRKCLEPVLVARIYNQPIVEEIPNSGMSMRMDHLATIREAQTHRRQICDFDC